MSIHIVSATDGIVYSSCAVICLGVSWPTTTSSWLVLSQQHRHQHQPPHQLQSQQVSMDFRLFNLDTNK